MKCLSCPFLWRGTSIFRVMGFRANMKGHWYPETSSVVKLLQFDPEKDGSCQAMWEGCLVDKRPVEQVIHGPWLSTAWVLWWGKQNVQLCTFKDILKTSSNKSVPRGQVRRDRLSGLLGCSDNQGQAGFFRGHVASLGLSTGATPSLLSWLNYVTLLCFFLSLVLGYLLRKNM